LLRANEKLSRGVSVLTLPIPQWVPYVAGGEKIAEKAIRNNAGMVPRENLEESVVRTGRDFPAGGNPCL